MIDWARSAEGAPLAAYLDGLGRYQDEYVWRRLRDWREPGTRPSYYEVDRVVTRLGLHVWLLPDQFWTRRAPTKRQPVSSLPRTCAHCGGPLKRTRGNRKRYCTPSCYRKAQVERSRELAELSAKQCECCGRTFTRTDVGLSEEAWRNRRFCTQACRMEWMTGHRRKATAA